ncbi:hypothetical protein NBRC116188_17290 [Oceaniserpentilla sp. 4NH20-0058]|uniref:YhfG family protein n=1 Tax=Oceaniserpentilla sp. 4NH20-0058 TaxID=3127660 RepID=UPI0031043614
MLKLLIYKNLIVMASESVSKKTTSLKAKQAYVKRTRLGNYFSSRLLEGLTTKKVAGNHSKEDVIAKLRANASA